jgi:hypothetical protein
MAKKEDKTTDASTQNVNQQPAPARPPENQGLPTRAVSAPLISDYFVKGDSAVGFRASLSPYRIKLNKSGDNGTINLEKKSRPVISYQDSITAVYLGVFSDKVTKRSFTNCNCNKFKLGEDGNIPKGDKGENVCFSSDRVFSIKGFKCTECPFPREDLKNGLAYRKRLTQEVLFAVRDPRDPIWYLASFTAKIDTIKEINDLFRKVHDEMFAKHGGKIGTEAIVEFKVRKQTIERGVVIVKFADCNIQAALNEDSYRKMRGFAEEVMGIKAAIAGEYHAIGEQKYKDMKATGTTAKIDSGPAEVEAPDHEEEETAATPNTTQAEVHVSENPDDDIPF